MIECSPNKIWIRKGKEEKELNFWQLVVPKPRSVQRSPALGESPISTDREKTDVKRKRKGKVEVERGKRDLRGKISRGEFNSHL